MDRDSVKAVQNQKVFVTLASVMEIQANFNRIVELAKQVDDNYKKYRVEHPETVDINNRFNTSKEIARGMAQVIRSLGLPINIPTGY